jgi:hypothetical protein
MPSLPLEGGSAVTFEAIDPTTGAAVAGVKLTSFTIYGDDTGAGNGDLSDVVPLYSLDEGSV